MRNNVLTWDQLTCPSVELDCILTDLFAKYVKIPAATPYPVATYSPTYVPLKNQFVIDGTDLYVVILTATTNQALTSTTHFLKITA